MFFGNTLMAANNIVPFSRSQSIVNNDIDSALHFLSMIARKIAFIPYNRIPRFLAEMSILYANCDHFTLLIILADYISCNFLPSEYHIALREIEAAIERTWLD